MAAVKKIAIVTSTRADWGLLRPLADALHNIPGVQLQIIATNMHLLPQFGNTVDEIIAAGHTVTARVPMHVDGDSSVARAHAMAECLAGMADTLAGLSPHIVVLLGDRYEILAAAEAAAMLRIPIAHIAGGTTSQGAIDDAMRHAITQLSTLHLTETEPFRQRIIAMGKDPDTVIATGALGVWNMCRRKIMDIDTLTDSLEGFALERASSLLVTYHPATLDASASPVARFEALLDALDHFPGSKILVTYPNNDAGGKAIAHRLLQWASSQPLRVKAVPSLGMERYIAALHHVAAVVGNSSSGIVEAPSAGIPTVDVGMRQQGRLCASSVAHCPDDTDSIVRAIKTALSPEAQYHAQHVANPYYRPDTVEIMTQAIMKVCNQIT